MKNTRHSFSYAGRHCAVLALLVLLTGCVTGPSLRALNPSEAKIDVYPTGDVYILGEKVELDEIHHVVKYSSTRPEDPILIRLHGDIDTPEMQLLCKVVTDQMIRAEHYKYQFFSTPKATVSTTDPITGKTEVYVSDQPVEILSGAEAQANIQQLIKEKEAYRDGSYVSDAAGKKPIETSLNRPEELKVNPTYVGDRPKQLKGLEFQEVPASSGSKRTSAKQKRSQTKSSSQEDLRRAWERQEQQHR